MTSTVSSVTSPSPTISSSIGRICRIRSSVGITLAHNVRSREEVHRVVEEARRNGAEITRESGETFYGGYAGVFRGLDGHAWEVAHNPAFGLDARGNAVLPSS